MEKFNFTEFEVVKRNGSLESFNSKKIMLMVEWASEGKNVVPNVLYEKFSLFIINEMYTSHIQKLLIKVALSLTTIEEPDWSDVAGNLLLLNIYKNHRDYMGDSSIFGYSKLYPFLRKATNDFLFNEDIICSYSENEIDLLNEDIDINYDDFDYSGVNLMDRRYLVSYKNVSVEPPQFMYAITALMVFKDYPNKDKRMDLVREYYYNLATQKISPATPNLSNLRKYGLGSSPSCFILKVEDNLESIYDTAKRAAIISKNGGASGIYLSSVRANGSSIQGKSGAAKGVIPWCRIYNDTAVAVDQLSVRTGAITVALDIWHKDIYDFLNMRKENIDLRLQAQDLFPQICMNDVFLDIYQKSKMNDTFEKDWLLFCPGEFLLLTGIKIEDSYGQDFKENYFLALDLFEKGRLTNCELVSSRNLMRHILETDKETGLPYWFNKDYVNETNPNKHEGTIYCSNLCVESFSTFNEELTHVCNLSSVNYANIASEDELEGVVRCSVRALNQIVSLSTSPLESTQRHNDRYRIIGIGALGFHDHLVMKNMLYTQSSTYAYELFEKVAYWAIDESVNETKIYGEYPAFSGSDWENGIFFGRNIYADDFTSTESMRSKWIHLYENRVCKFGMANGSLLAIAPNTGTSQLVNSSASVLPVFKKFFIEKNKMLTPFAAKYLSDKTFWLYQEAVNIDPLKIINMCQNIQQWTDQGISMEIVMNNNIYNNAPDLLSWYLSSMIGDGEKKRSKAVYYLRPIDKSTNDKECSSCAN